MKRNPLRTALALLLALTLLLALAPTALAEGEDGSQENPYVYTGFNEGKFTEENGFKVEGYDKEDLAFGAFVNWVNAKLQTVDDLYVRIEVALITSRQDIGRASIIIPDGKTLHLELANSAKVGNTHGATVASEPYFLVEPDGTLEITGTGRIVNEEEDYGTAASESTPIQDLALIVNYGT